MSKCEQSGCLGHLGKFDSCRDEALWQISLDTPIAEGGSTEFDGYAALVVVDQDGEREHLGYTIVDLAPGAYIVFTAPTGGVTVTECESAAAATLIVEEHAARYYQWEDGEAP